MANNCLVTKLKGTVDNDSIARYGEFSFKVLAGDTYRFGISSGSAFTVRTDGGNILYLDGGAASNILNIPANQIAYVNIAQTSKDVTIYINLKYNAYIGYISFIVQNKPNRVVFDIDELKYIGNANQLFLGGLLTSSRQQVSGSLTSFTQFSGMTNFSVNGVTGINEFFRDTQSKSVLAQVIIDGGEQVNLTDMSEFTALTNLTLRNVVGTFATLASMPNIHNTTFVESQGVTGSVEDFVAIKKLAGAGSISLYWPKVNMPNITYQGQPISTYPASVIPHTANVTMSWDAQGNIAWSAS